MIAMLSHDLARILLAHRNNDVRIEVLVDDDPAGERAIRPQWCGLRDSMPAGSGFAVPAGEVVVYDAEDDVLVVRAGVVAVGDPT